MTRLTSRVILGCVFENNEICCLTNINLIKDELIVTSPDEVPFAVNGATKPSRLRSVTNEFISYPFPFPEPAYWAPKLKIKSLGLCDIMYGMSNKTKIFLQVLAVFGLAIAINFVSYLNKKHNSICSELVKDMCPQH
jgi:hypothetical protein